MTTGAPRRTAVDLLIFDLDGTLIESKWDIATATDFTKIGTDAAAGTGRCMILDRHIVRNGLDEHLDPDRHGGLTGLNSLAQFEVYAILQVQNTAFHPID